MSYANGTQFYNLPQTVGTDKRDWFDTNQPFAAIDAALHTAVVGQASDAEAIATINSKLATDEADIAALQTKTNTHDSQIATLQTTVNAQAAQITDVRQDSEDMITANNEGAAATSTRAYAIGDYFIYNDVLYKASAAIAVGDTIVPNTNCKATNVDTELTGLNNDLANYQPLAKTIEISATTDAKGRITGEAGSGFNKIALSAWRVNSSNIVEIYRYVNPTDTINTINYKVVDSETGEAVANTAMTIKLAYLETTLI